MHLTVIQVFYVIFSLHHGIGATHFRGGTISWKPIGNGTEVGFSFKLGWAYNRGPGCTAERIGQFIDELIPYNWKCTDGCSTPRNIANTSYICTGASESENWEQGENTFTYTFPGIGPYTVELTGRDWMNMSYGSPGKWSIGTVVNLSTRNDTNKPNISPITTGKPIYVAQYGCYNEISIPVVDPDGDEVRCRWANGTECMSMCEGLPYATIDYDNCTIRFMANHTSNGTFAVAVTVEDYPKSNISIDGSIHLTTSPLSTITLQFIVETPVLPAVNCTDKPRFVRPTLVEGTILHTDILKDVNISFFASSNRGISNIDLTVPAGMDYTPVQSNLYINYSFVHSSWIPQQNQVGFHLVYAIAKDNAGKTSESRCITIVVKDISPCNSSPCKNGGTCVRQKITQNYVCNCLPGYTGNVCDKDIDECASSPCQNQGMCNDHVNHYECTCVAGYSGYQCQIEIDEFTDHPCSSLFDCQDLINQYSCSLMAILMMLMLIAGVLTLLFFLAKSRRYKDVDHSWLANFQDIRKPDSQPKPVFRTKIHVPHKKLQHHLTEDN
ncbi:integrin beta-like protein A [Crassostrea angulata]|uniref:integrin beta-like protein A n=1 Tax=Magallana angulata TaxID=2784310 RepID=UPI0022B21B76|nr:integrin beta-like protein A [Crassostrea angulata]